MGKSGTSGKVNRRLVLLGVGFLTLIVWRPVDGGLVEDLFLDRSRCAAFMGFLVDGPSSVIWDRRLSLYVVQPGGMGFCSRRLGPCLPQTRGRRRMRCDGGVFKRRELHPPRWYETDPFCISAKEKTYRT